MTARVISASPDTKPQEAVSLMRRNKIRRLVVTENDEVCGILCNRDLVKAAERLGTEKQITFIRDVMKSPVITVGPDDPIENAARLMTKHHIGSLVVTRNKTPIGIITESDIFRAFTYLLTSDGNSARITFDITKGEKILEYLVESTSKFELQLRSYLSFQDKDRLLAVAIVRGDRLNEFTDSLWESGHLVVNLVKPKRFINRQAAAR